LQEMSELLRDRGLAKGGMPHDHKGQKKPDPKESLHSSLIIKQCKDPAYKALGQ
jgi:hypothetical protein